MPAHEVIRIGKVAALQVDRFDRAGTRNAWHCISAASALRLLPNADPDDPKRSYVALRSKLREPKDAEELFKRVVLNAAVGNNDDHPWNTSLRQLGLRTWELSPLYDVQPFFVRSHIPSFRMAILKNRRQDGNARQSRGSG